MLVLPGTISGGRWVSERFGLAPLVARTATLAVLFPLALVFAFSETFSPFLYFQF